mgnify:CR=1 FL=1
MKAFVSYLTIIPAGDINDGSKCKEREDKHIGELSLCSSSLRMFVYNRTHTPGLIHKSLNSMAQK